MSNKLGPTTLNAISPIQPDDGAERTTRYRRMCAELADLGMTDPAIIFTRLVTSVRDCMILEARLATGPATPSRAAALTLRADPRRASLQKVFRRVTDHHPDHADLVRETNARIDEDLAADPDRTLDLRTIFFTICEDLGIEPDLAILPDEYIGLFPDTPAPDPRASSPP